MPKKIQWQWQQNEVFRVLIQPKDNDKDQYKYNDKIHCQKGDFRVVTQPKDKDKYSPSSFSPGEPGHRGGGPQLSDLPGGHTKCYTLSLCFFDWQIEDKNQL